MRDLSLSALTSVQSTLYQRAEFVNTGSGWALKSHEASFAAVPPAATPSAEVEDDNPFLVAAVSPEPLPYGPYVPLAGPSHFEEAMMDLDERKEVESAALPNFWDF